MTSHKTIVNIDGHKFIINNNGNFGIDTTNPTQKLHVDGGIKSSDIIVTGSGIEPVLTKLGSTIYGEAAGDYFGYSVSLSNDGTIMAVGAIYNDGTGTDSGHVRVYEYSSGSWSQLGLDIDGEAAGDYSGISVSLSNDGTILAVGAIYNDGNGSNSGHTRVYEYSSGSWSQMVEIDGEAAGDAFGLSVSLSGDGTILAIGAIFNDGVGSNSGHVRVYQFSSGSWSQMFEIDGEAAGDSFGSSVSLSNDGTTLAVGAIFNDGVGTDSGHVRVYEYSSGSWSQMGSDIDGEAAGDAFGISVSLSNDGTTLAIGAISNDGGGSDSGHVRVYQFSSGSWSQMVEIDGEAAGDSFGRSVSLSNDGTILAVGAHLANNSTGVVRIYQFSSGSWTKIGSDIEGSGLGSIFGFAVSLSRNGKIVAACEPENDTNGTDRGAVRVYTIINDLVQASSLSNSVYINGDTEIFGQTKIRDTLSVGTNPNIGTEGQILVSKGTNPIEWVDPTSSDIITSATSGGGITSQKTQFVYTNGGITTLSSIESKNDSGTYSMTLNPYDNNPGQKGVTLLANNNNTRVGINVANPTEELEIDGNIQLDSSNQSRIIFYDTQNNHEHAEIDALGEGTNGGHLIFHTKTDLGSVSEKMRITDTGNVGIGTTNPSEKLEVDGNIKVNNNILGSNQTLKLFTDTTSINSYSFMAMGNTLTTIGCPYFRVLTNSSNTDLGIERFTINSAGDVGIGTSAPIEKLDVAGRIKGDNLSIGSDLIYTDGTNVGIGTKIPSEKLEVNGNIRGDNLFLGKHNTTPLIEMFFEDKSVSTGNNNNHAIWDTKIEIGKSDDFTNSPAYPPSNAYGMNVQANSDGLFVGVETYNDGNDWRPLLKWGDDSTDTPFRIVSQSGGHSYEFGTTGDFKISGKNFYINENARLETNVVGNDADLIFYTKGGGVLNERLRILSNGNVGINKTNPGEKLEVNGTIKASNLKIDGYLDLNPDGDLAFNAQLRHDNFYPSAKPDQVKMLLRNHAFWYLQDGTDTANGGDGNRKMSIDAQLEVNETFLCTSDATIRNAFFNYQFGGSRVTISHKDQANKTTGYALTFDNNSGTVLNAESGYFSALSVADNYQLRVYNDHIRLGDRDFGNLNNVAVSVDAADIGGTDAVGYSTSSDGNWILIFYNAARNGNKGKIRGTGASNGVVYDTSSDRRLKENVTPMPSMLEKIKQLEPVYYTWKSDGKKGDGFIAQEVHKVFPQMRDYNCWDKCKCGMTFNDAWDGKTCMCEECDVENLKDVKGNDYIFGLDYGKFTPYIIKAMQEQQEIIERQEKLIESLVSRVDALEKNYV